MSSAYKVTSNNNETNLKRTKSVTSIVVADLGLDFANQSALDPNEENARVSRLCDADFDLLSFYGLKTMHDVFQKGIKLAGDQRCLGWRADSSSPYQWMTYNQVQERATALGSGLMALGIQPSNDTRIGVYAQNRPEYVIADQAFVRHSLCGVPLYDTLGAEAGVFIINQADLEVIICDKNEKVQKLLDNLSETPKVSTVIVMDAITDEIMAKAKDAGLKIMQFSEVEEMGEKNPATPNYPSPDDDYIICYTSGTTGTPKGAMVSHRNIISNLCGCIYIWEKYGLNVTPDDVHISYLPLAHAYERILEALCLTHGVAIGFFQGDVRQLLDDIKELQPTIFPCVPRLLNRIHDKVLAGVNASRIKKMLFNMALKSKKKDLAKGVIRNNTLWDKLVFSKVQALMGGRVRLLSTGAAPLSAEVLTFLKCIMGCPIIEGYGQTECTAVATLTYAGDSEAGHVGSPLPGVKVKLMDVPDMKYFAKDDKGEVCIKGFSVIKGYLKNEEKTKETIDESGWLHTGDVGQWLPNGTLKIIDRKKHIFKLAQGEYIAPEKIENILVQSPYVAQVFVHGHSLETCLVAVVVPDPETLPDLAKKLGVTGTIEQLAADPVVKKAIMTDLKEVGQKNKLSSLEQVKEIHVHPEMFSVENGLLTPTFKSKRNELASYFANIINDLYEKTKAVPAPSKL